MYLILCVFTVIVCVYQLLLNVIHTYSSISATYWLLGNIALSTLYIYIMKGYCIYDSLMLMHSVTSQSSILLGHVFLRFKFFSLCHPLNTSAWIYPSDRGLSLWKCQDGELPITTRCQRQCQNQGRQTLLS